MPNETSKVEPGKSDDDAREPSVLWVVVAGLGGAMTLAAAYWRFRTGFAVGTLEAHAALGNALAPVVAFLTLLAVVAALWSVQVQRTELALQRQELRETREEMVEQRKQFERTAVAQEALARSQAALANAQFDTVQQTAALRMAQHGNSIATLEAALATIEAGAVAAAETLNIDRPDAQQALADRRQAISNRINRELQLEERVETYMRSGAYDREPTG